MAYYFIRHGQSEGNAGGVIQGSSEYGLTALGREQARIAGAWLASIGLQPAAMFASPLRRAAETAQIVAAQLANLPQPVTAPEVTEMDAGALAGLTREQAGQAYPDYITRSLDERGCMAPFGGESYEDLQARLTRFINQIVSLQGDVLTVAHGGSLYHLLKLWCGWPTPRHFFARINNCSVLKVVTREVAGHRIGELQWLVPLELMGGGAPRGLDSPDEG